VRALAVTPVRLNPENPRNLFEPSDIDAREETKKKAPAFTEALRGGADHALRDFCYVGCLRTFLTLDDLELHTIALGQRFETAA